MQWAFSSQQSPTQITTQFAYPGPQIAGNLNIVVVETHGQFTDGPVHLVDSVEDTAGNHYQFVPIDTLGNGLSHLSGPGFNIQQSIYFAVPIFGQLRNTVTVTFTDLAQLIDIRILEYSLLTYAFWSTAAWPGRERCTSIRARVSPNLAAAA